MQNTTLGDLIDKLKVTDESLQISPKIVGISAYRGYYSDIALCTVAGENAYKSSDRNHDDWQKWHEENLVKIDFVQNPRELANLLESLIGKYFDGYKGGYNQITREKPLWLASDYGNSSQIAIVGITDGLDLVTKNVEI